VNRVPPNVIYNEGMIGSEETGRSLTAEQLLELYLRSGSVAESESVLSRLISLHANPLIQEIVRHKLHTRIEQNTVRGADAAEVCSAVLVKLLNKLQEWKLNPTTVDPNGFLDYVAVCTYHQCNQYWRESHPLRNRLKNRLLYLLTTRKEFALWKNGKVWICGMSEWKDRSDLAEEPTLNRLNSGTFRKQNSLEQLQNILQQSNAPVRLSDLLDLLSKLQGIAPNESYTDPVGELPDVRCPRIEQELEQREFLRQLWTEIQKLPVKQRTALLLSLRDDSGGALLQLFPALGIARIKELAVALNMEPKQVANLWKDLPLDDLRIGSILGNTRQQVINLRKCARERLARKFETKEAI